MNIKLNRRQWVLLFAVAVVIFDTICPSLPIAIFVSGVFAAIGSFEILEPIE